ncbi:hypothetical protein [Ktedonospora formicarum]|uniref:Uncharacterized protein n=1 Tax=Ktedonospora formicarum TaxID=2778364 RepID=A0A8J3I320_9CHLR|nr:hypothetical protein [Ktedonospora formicarum]GHO48404.1 hypothetical protein KSX_65670 [Ktedonospora formicarum]
MPEALPIPGYFSNSPFHLDTHASLRFSAAETMEMCVMVAGQPIALAKGYFSIQTHTRTSALLSCFGLKEYAPTSVDACQGQPVGTLESFSVMVSCEQDAFAFKQPPQGDDWNADEWPCVLYRVRYAFAFDPLSRLQRDNASTSSGMGSEASTTGYYYRQNDMQKLTIGQLKKLDIFTK